MRQSEEYCGPVPWLLDLMALRKLPHFCLLVALLFAGCSETKKKQPKPKPSWTFESEKAPYLLTLPGEWKKEDPAVLNEFADLAVTHPDDLFFIVIPQELPQIEGVDSPDALDLKRAGVTLMEAQIEDLQIQKQGPVRVDQRQGQSVVARGIVDGQEVKYLTTYLTEGDWGFQLIGWAPIERRRALLVRIDELLTGWRFAAKPEDDLDISPDAGTPDSGDPPTE